MNLALLFQVMALLEGSEDIAVLVVLGDNGYDVVIPGLGTVLIGLSAGDAERVQKELPKTIDFVRFILATKAFPA